MRGSLYNLACGLAQHDRLAARDAQATAMTFSIVFDPAVESLLRLSRQTGKAETVRLSNHKLDGYTLPGGTGDLFKFPSGPK